MQNVIAENQMGERLIDKTFLDDDVAQAVFASAIRCEDCGWAMLIDGMTGELIADWNRGTLSFYNFSDAKILRHIR